MCSFLYLNPHLTIILLLVYTNSLLATLNARKSISPLRPTSTGGGVGGGSRMMDRTLSLRNLPSSPDSPHVRNS
jgi:hypothetical protein